MPIIQVQVSVPRSADTTRRIGELLLEHTTQVLGKKRELTAITVDYVDPADWIVAGRTLAEQGVHSFHVDIKVVDETNTKAEKARYIAAVFDAFGTLLGRVHEESYIHVHDVRATAYGFGGRTQEYRHQHPG